MTRHSKESSLHGIIDSDQNLEWLCYISAEKNIILSKGSQNPITTLLKVFELCIDNFDGLHLDEKQPILYRCLLTLYHENEKKPIMNSLEKYLTTISTLVKTFRQNQYELQHFDISLYYAILNFIDLLKTKQGNHIYRRLIF